MKNLFYIVFFLFLNIGFLKADDNCDEAESALNKYFNAIKEKKCDLAIILRPDYKKDTCNQVKSIDWNIKLKSCNIDSAIFFVKAEVIKNINNSFSNESSLNGVGKLIINKNKWVITGFYKEKETGVDHNKINLYKENNITVLSNNDQKDISLLSSCWTQEEIKGNLKDKIIHKTPLDNNPPERDLAILSNNEIKGVFKKSIRSVHLPDDKKYIAITFDLCEKANERSGYDYEIINFLRDHQVKSTLFAGGKWMRSHPEKTKQLMADPLFELGNHAWTHGNLRILHGEEMKKQIRWTQSQYEILRDDLLNSSCAIPFRNKIEIKKIPTVFRFPYGVCDQESLKAVSEYGLEPIQWNIVTGDPSKKQSSEAIVNSILSQSKPGSIIIAHANGRGWNTAHALPKVITELRMRGYKFVKVSELLEMGTPVTTDTCYELKPNDNIKYDKLFGKGTE